MAERNLVRIQEKGQVTLPAAMRKKLGLKKGDLVAVLETPDGVLISRRSRCWRTRRWIASARSCVDRVRPWRS